VLASLTGRAYALLLKSEFSSALELIARARKLSPQSANLAALSGWTHYRLNQMDPHCRSPDCTADPAGRQSASLLEKAERDKEAEDDSERRIAPFVIRYHGGASRQLASE